MEVWTPLRAHAEWITLFRESLYVRAALPPPMIADEHACEVGRWLCWHKTTLGYLREYRSVKEAHQRFHHQAAYCFRLAALGYRLEALAQAETDGELRRLSRLLVTSFQDLNRAIRFQRLEVKWDVAACT